MASIGTIKVSEDLRPAIYWYSEGSGQLNVLVHMGRVGESFVVEFDDGVVAYATADQLRFLDSEDQFAAYNWDAMLDHIEQRDKGSINA